MEVYVIIDGKERPIESLKTRGPGRFKVEIVIRSITDDVILRNTSISPRIFHLVVRALKNIEGRTIASQFVREALRNISAGVVDRVLADILED